MLKNYKQDNSENHWGYPELLATWNYKQKYIINSYNY
jgi:hypothetical protein